MYVAKKYLALLNYTRDFPSIMLTAISILGTSSLPFQTTRPESQQSTADSLKYCL
jgi:hypothetical protein